MLRGDRTVAMTKDVAGGRSDLSQGKNPERGHAFCLVREETMQGIFWDRGRRGEILGVFCEMPTEYDNFRQMRYDKIFYY